MVTATALVTLVLAAAGPAAAAEEKNPFLEAARTLLQEQLQGGGLLQGLLQGGGGGGGGKQDVLSGLGSLLQGSGGQQEASGGIDPQLVGHFVNLFAGGQDGGENNNVDENNNDAGGSVDWEGIIGLASSFLGQKQGNRAGGGGGGGMEGLLNLLPILLQSQGAAQKLPPRVAPRATPGIPFLGTVLEYWDHFRSSELGRTLWRSSGLEATVRLFTDERGNFQADKIFSSLENHSFRRRWIKSLTSFVASWAAYMAQPETQARYLGTFQIMANNFLKAQGYHKGALFDPARPTDSLSHLVNSVFKRQFGLKVNSATYIKPAVAYIQDVFKLGQSKGIDLSHLTPQEMESKMADTLNGEIIEPVLRVWRAYRFSLHRPQCDRHVICSINSAENIGDGIKPGVTKLSSLVASWFLSRQTGTPFWKLYNAATEEHNCQVQYPVDCDEFHTEDIKATTEYAHSEL